MLNLLGGVFEMLYLYIFFKKEHLDRVSRLITPLEYFYRIRFGDDVKSLGGQTVEDSIPRDADVYIVGTCQIVCDKNGVNFDPTKDDFSYSIDTIDGIEVGVCRIFPQTRRDEIKYECSQEEIKFLQDIESLTGRLKFRKTSFIKSRRMSFFTENNHIIEIGLRNCYLSNLPQSIGSLKFLKRFDLGYNQFTTLPESIGNITSLQNLNLDNNQLTTLPKSIGNLTSLTNLYLDDNQLTTLPESITELKALQQLNLGYNRFTTLPESITELKTLQQLNLGYNRFTTLPESIGNLTSLQSLYLGNNQLTTLPESIGNLTSLQSLYLGNNQLTTLPESICNLKFLGELDLKVNKLIKLPESLKKMNKLKGLIMINELN